ncbi:MAG TPA: hypothetical protein VHF06_00235 [Pseudonocardiaceae bacterium]|jgi:hypothetical protein|nr:hypothetical protein [Pseudonocardiaceae bacterium]
MARIHHTTLTPTKLELLAGWLPKQPWYCGGTPELTKAGGFRLDDPAGEVGIEFMVVTDGSTGDAVSYHVPLTYRAAACADAEAGFIGTAEHGVLGTRWIYDGVHDPVLIAQLLALIGGQAQPQAQSVSDTPDPSVVGRSDVTLAVAGPVVDGTDIPVTVADTDRGVLRVVRVLEPDDSAPEGVGHVAAGWRMPDGTEARGRFAVVRRGQSSGSANAW